MDLLNLPIIIVEHIISQLSYDEMAKTRLVSKAFNEICMRMLSRGFHMVEKRHATALKMVKAQLPRRESERRYHPLARHCDILTSIETRISMLNMTYSKFIDHGMCCFIPGKVIDEIKRVLDVVENSKSPPRAHEVLQELRDISSMAIEHFDDKISPPFRKRLQMDTVIGQMPRPGNVTKTMPSIRQELCQLRKRSILNAKLSLYLASQFTKTYKRMMGYKRLAFRQKKTLMNLSKRQKEQDAAICELKKRIDECDVKYSELTHTNQAVGGKSANETATSQPLRHFGSQIKLDLSVLPIGTSKRNHKLLPNIKARKAQINLPSLSQVDLESPTQEIRYNPVPSTSSAQTPKPKTPSTMTKIRDITQEIRHLSNLSKCLDDKLKRTHDLDDSDYVEFECKKQKVE